MPENIALILQVRMGSTRLPQKVLRKLNGFPLIEYIVERVKQTKHQCKLIIATSDKQEDTPIVHFAQQKNIDFFKGSENNVLQRYYLAAKQFNATQIVRLTGDNPFVEPDFIDRLIDFHRAEKNDFSTNKGEYGSFAPIGTGMSIFSFQTLKKAYENASSAYDKEHVIPYILNNKDEFRFGIHQIETLKQDYSAIELTVDTYHDFQKINNIAEILNITPKTFVSVYEIIEKQKLWNK